MSSKKKNLPVEEIPAAVVVVVVVMLEEESTVVFYPMKNGEAVGGLSVRRREGGMMI